MIEQVLYNMLLVGIIAIFLGIAIAAAKKFFYVAPDERIKIIYDMLPHFNCGACGTPGCQAFAETLVSGENKPVKCRPCKPDQRVKIQDKLKEMEIE